MYFSSLLFLFVFLPVVLVIYYILPRKARNCFLLLSNLIFYGWGEPVLILIMIISIMTNYICGLFIEKYRQNQKRRRAFLILSLVISLGLLAVFKYTAFLSDILRQLPPFSFMPKISIPLPIGISFYTFQTISYTIDVYRGDTKAQRNIVSFGTYVSFFPQLIAGPIVRYIDIADMLDRRRESVKQFSDGIKLFIIGLSKKVLIANQMGLLWDSIRTAEYCGAVGAWTGIIAYALQIYFDFSGYSDMARGLGKMFGFEFLENFDYPYIAKSITEFWRRWHISLSTWFRDYVYIPLGGNRQKTPRVIFNLFVVWGLTGLWHGASLNFIIWGLYYFVLLILEKYIYGKYLEQLPKAFQHIYALFFILIGWLLFYFEDRGQLLQCLNNMFMMSNGDILGMKIMGIILSYWPLLMVSALAILPLWKNIYIKIQYKKITAVLEIIFCMTLLILCNASLVNQSYNPFLYFRF